MRRTEHSLVGIPVSRALIPHDFYSGVSFSEPIPRLSMLLIPIPPQLSKNMNIYRLLSILAILVVAIANAAAQQVSDTGIQEPLPRLTTAADLFNSTERPAEPWTGFDPARYKDMSFYKNDGIAHLRGRIIGYTPDCEVKTIFLWSKDGITESDQTCAGDINPDGKFSVDIPMTYPQYYRFSIGNIHRNMFLIPGDTLSVVTSMEEVKRGNEYESRYFGYEGEINDVTAVNLLADSISRHFGLDDLLRRSKIENTDSVKVRTYAVNEEIAAVLDTVIASLPSLLGNLPVSNFAKDILSVTAIGDAAQAIEDLRFYFLFATGKRILPSGQSAQNGDTTPVENLDDATFIAPHKKHLDILYDNPLLMCKSWLLGNRWRSDTMLESLSCYFVKPYGVGDLRAKVDVARLDSLGIGDCFAAQLSRASKTIINMERPDVTVSPLQEEYYAARTTAILKNSDYDVIDKALMSSYGRYLKRIALLENQLDTKETVSVGSTAYSGILESIIAPYRGNVLFLDFWSISCGPCRQGMIQQKPILDEYAGKSFKTLYIASTDEIVACKKWLQKEDIKGEHIFISQNDYNRLMALFNFCAVPYGVIIDSNGKVVRAGNHVSPDKRLIDKLLSDK